MKASDVEIASLARERGWISEERAKASLAEADRYQALGLEKSVDEVLLERGDLSQEQVKSLRDALGFNIKYPRVGDYEITRRVGMGGMGTVFEAVHVRLKQRIALKILLPRLSRDPRATDRFLREARTLARLNHPHLVHAVDAGQDGDRYYLAMEYVEGENLLQVLLRDGPLDPLRSLEVVHDICEALEVLESKGLVHRDVKPANILIGLDGQVRLADLGLLTAVEENGPGGGPVCGTPHYISPEQLSKKGEVDIRSDIYSLGATWFHVLVGRPPFTGKSTREIVQGHLRTPPPAPSSIRADVPQSIDRIVLEWLSKDPAARPKSMREALAQVVAARAALRRRATLRAMVRARILAPAGVLLIAVAILIAWRAAPFSRPVERAAAHGSEAAPAEDAATPPQPAAQVTDAAAPPPGTQSPAPAARAPEHVEPPRAVEAATFPDHASLHGPPVLTAVLKGARTAAARWADLRASLEPGVEAAARGFEGARMLAGTFHAPFVAIRPGEDPPRSIVLGYAFRSGKEIDDFRAPRGSWSVEDGALFAHAEPRGEPLVSLAWFVPPLRIEGEVAGPGPLIAGWGSLRTAPGRGPDARIWREEADADTSVLAAPQVPEGLWAVTFREGSIEIETAGRSARIEAPPPRDPAEARAGRAWLKLGAGIPLASLRIEGTLEPSWAAERARLVPRGR